MKLRRIKEILHVCEKTIDNYVNRIGTSDEIVEYIENLQFQLKAKEDNWNYIKKMLKEARNEEFNINGYCGTCTDVDIDFLLSKMEELEILSKGENK